MHFSDVSTMTNSRSVCCQSKGSVASPFGALHVIVEWRAFELIIVDWAARRTICCMMSVVGVRLYLCRLHCSIAYLCSGLFVVALVSGFKVSQPFDPSWNTDQEAQHIRKSMGTTKPNGETKVKR